MPLGNAVITGGGGRCLDDEVLALLLEGALDEVEDGEVRSHLDRCDDCRKLFAEAARSSESVAPDGSGRRKSVIKPMTLEPGAVVADKYRILRRIGEGGMGYVLAARHVALDGMVALKVMRPEVLNDNDAVRRFAREGKAAASLKSEHAVRIFDVGRLDSGTPYIVMEYLEGSDLASILDKNGPLPIATAIDYMIQVCEAVDEAHRLGIIHRDLKPHNMFLTRGVTGEPCMKVLDFGLAKAVALSDGETSMTGTNVMLGSPFFMSPEQIHSTRDVDHRTDIWSLGASLYHLVTGTPPFVAPNVHLVCARILTEDFMPVQKRRPDAPPELDALLRCCMSRSVEARFSKVSELVRALKLLRGSQRVSQPDAPEPPTMNTGDMEILSDGTMSTAPTLLRASATPPPPSDLAPDSIDHTTLPKPVAFRRTDPIPPVVQLPAQPHPALPPQAPRLDSAERRAVAGTRSAVVLGILAAMALVAVFIALRFRARSTESVNPIDHPTATVVAAPLPVPVPVPESSATAPTSTSTITEPPSTAATTLPGTSTKRPPTKKGPKGHSDPDPYARP